MYGRIFVLLSTRSPRINYLQVMDFKEYIKELDGEDSDDFVVPDVLLEDHRHSFRCAVRFLAYGFSGCGVA